MIDGEPQYPVTIRVGDRDYVIDGQWRTAANGDRCRQLVYEGLIFKIIRRADENSSDLVLEQHFQLHPRLCFYAHVSKLETDDRAAYFGAVNILCKHQKWAALTELDERRN